ncbi:magnesium transporter [Prosthecomicrobium pneumaticum]|uniref:Magnesium transporter MgtE n=1 Tax=Prosthecomicrobium pneumaticum TaxID=81895 RepID=A0A7W9L348_9HYPH|nr:magnesium transporter [Prosthecomicrobium pneumaticum]MBB5754177.1 magnesium transporter [Prosthecomicrobium pneumaticum]
MADETSLPDDAPAAFAPPPLRDEDDAISAGFLEALRETLATGDRDTARLLTEDLHEADLGAILEALEPEERTGLIQLLGTAFDFTALTELDESVRVQILEELPAAAVAEGVRELDSDDAVYILEDLDAAEQAEILAQIPSIERQALKRSLDYPEESAGRRMQTEFVAVPPFWTVGQTIDYMREEEDLPESFYEIFVVDPAFHLLGTVALSHVLRSKRPTPISELVDEAHHLVPATEDQEEVARMFERYNLVSAAVVDEDGRLVGVLTIDDIVDVIQEEADEDLKALAGVNAEEEISDTVLWTARSRFPWLFANMFTAFVSASVIGAFESAIAGMVALAVLMPIVASMGGNAGTQAMAVTVRAIATRELRGRTARRVLARELSVGFLNGAVLACFVGSLAGFWFGDPHLGVVIGIALVLNLIVAGTVGVLVPMTLDKLKVDPAVASSVFVTMTTDSVGYLAFLGLATWWFALR